MPVENELIIGELCFIKVMRRLSASRLLVKLKERSLVVSSVNGYQPGDVFSAIVLQEYPKVRLRLIFHRSLQA